MLVRQPKGWGYEKFLSPSLASLPVYPAFLPLAGITAEAVKGVPEGRGIPPANLSNAVKSYILVYPGA